MACARGGDVDAVAALLDRGAALDAGESSRGQTALMWAAAHRHPDVVRVLIAHGADVHARSRVSHLLVPTNAYASGVSHRDTVEMPMGGFTPLLFAARHGDVDSARLLLDAGGTVVDFRLVYRYTRRDIPARFTRRWLERGSSCARYGCACS